jgi:protein-tyrosine phosphatase
MSRLRELAALLRHRHLREDWSYERARARGVRPALPPGPIRRVVVICHGNICRSPFAGLLLAREREDLEVRSAGLAARAGKPAEPGARRAVRRYDLDLEEHGARPFEREDVDWADLILGMQGRHAREVARRWPDAAGKTLLLGDFLSSPPYAIADPWGEPDAVFDATFDQIARSVSALCEALPRVSGER